MSPPLAIRAVQTLAYSLATTRMQRIQAVDVDRKIALARMQGCHKVRGSGSLGMGWAELAKKWQQSDLMSSIH